MFSKIVTFGAVLAIAHAGLLGQQGLNSINNGWQAGSPNLVNPAAYNNPWQAGLSSNFGRPAGLNNLWPANNIGNAAAGWTPNPHGSLLPQGNLGSAWARPNPLTPLGHGAGLQNSAWSQGTYGSGLNSAALGYRNSLGSPFGYPPQAHASPLGFGNSLAHTNAFAHAGPLGHSNPLASGIVGHGHSSRAGPSAHGNSQTSISYTINHPSPQEQAARRAHSAAPLGHASPFGINAGYPTGLAHSQKFAHGGALGHNAGLYQAGALGHNGPLYQAGGLGSAPWSQTGALGQNAPWPQGGALRPHAGLHQAGAHGHYGQYAGGYASADNYSSYPKYEYSYSVEDPHTGDHKSQHEERDGDVVKGEYSLLQPDGSISKVSYSADDRSGFNAVVENNNPNKQIYSSPAHH